MADTPRSIQVLPVGGDSTGLTEAESMGVIVAAAMAAALNERDQARELAVRLEQELAESERHLKAMVEIVGTSTWAADTRTREQAQAWLDRSPEPTE